MSAFDAYMRLDGALKGFVSCDVPMSKHTTYHIGGPAALFIEVATLADLSLTLDVLTEEDVPWTVVGKGSNLLVHDNGYEGAVIMLGSEFKGLEYGGYQKGQEPAPKEVIVTAGAGVTLSQLVQKCFSLGLSGMEFAVGTPGTLGGAIRMNAGTDKNWIGAIVDSVTTIAPGEGLRCRLGSEINWDYRTNDIPANEVVVEATLRCKPSDEMMLHAAMEATLKRRRTNQPLDKPSCGSVFRNPEGVKAGKLIEDCGLKGYSIGGAQVSEKHANFIINAGGATAEDVAALIRLVRDKVGEEHGVELRPEVKFLGFPQ